MVGMSRKVTAALVLSVGNVLFTAMIALIIGQLFSQQAQIAAISPSLGTAAALRAPIVAAAVHGSGRTVLSELRARAELWPN